MKNNYSASGAHAKASNNTSRDGANNVRLVVLATVPVLDPAGFIGLRGNGLTPSKIDDFLSEPSL